MILLWPHLLQSNLKSLSERTKITLYPFPFLHCFADPPRRLLQASPPLQTACQTSTVKLSLCPTSWSRTFQPTRALLNAQLDTKRYCCWSKMTIKESLLPKKRKYMQSEMKKGSTGEVKKWTREGKLYWKTIIRQGKWCKIGTQFLGMLNISIVTRRQLCLSNRCRKKMSHSNL